MDVTRMIECQLNALAYIIRLVHKLEPEEEHVPETTQQCPEKERKKVKHIGQRQLQTDLKTYSERGVISIMCVVGWFRLCSTQ